MSRGPIILNKNWFINKYIVEQDMWNTSKIEERERQLLKKMVEIYDEEFMNLNL